MRAPHDDDLLGPDEVAAWLDVDRRWLEGAVTGEGLPLMGRRADGDPVVCAGELRAWLRRPDPHGDET